MSYILAPDGRIWVPLEKTPPGDLIVVPEPTYGRRAGVGSVFYRVIHDDMNPGWNFSSRTLLNKSGLRITNEMYVPRRYYFREDDRSWRVDRYSKISFWPESNSDWLDYFISGMGPWVWERFCRSGFGWRDSKADLDALNIYNFILTGGSLLEGAGRWREYILFKTQDFNLPPEGHTYMQRPDRVFKQWLVGHNRDNESYWAVDKGEVGGMGDVYIPTASPGGISAILSSEVRVVPVPPYDDTVGGYPIHVVEHCFQGDRTLGKTADGWVVLEETIMSGNPSDRTQGGTWQDWIPYADKFKTLPHMPSIIGWTRQS